MIDRVIGLLGLALALIFGMTSLAPEGWPKVPAWASYCGVGVGVLLVGIAIGVAVADYRRKPQFADSQSCNFIFIRINAHQPAFHIQTSGVGTT